MKSKGRQRTGNHSFFSRNTLYHQLRVLFVVAILVPLLVFGIFLSVFGYRNIETNYENLCESKASQVRTTVLITTISVDQIRNNLTDDDTFMQLVQGKYRSAKEARQAFSDYRGIRKTRDSSPEIEDIRIYVDENTLQSSNNIREFYPIDSQIRGRAWYKKASTYIRPFWVSSERMNEFGVSNWRMRYYSRITLPKTHSFAIVCITVSNNYIRSLLAKNGYNVRLSINDNPVFFSTERSEEGQAMPVSVPAGSSTFHENGSGNIASENTIYSIASFRPYKSDDSLHVLVDNPVFFSQLQSMMRTVLILGIAIICASAFIVLMYGRYYHMRINTLRLAISKVANDDYEIVNQIRGNDELSESFAELKQMAERLKEREADYYRSKLDEQELIASQQQMELKLLAGQINPHFLYNTLEMLRMQALINKDRKVSAAIKVLGNCMRYVLSNTLSASTTLDKEIAYMYDYLFIMNMRFTDRLSYEVRVDEDIDKESVRILPLLIQPLVENSIIHGIEESENGGTVIIDIRRISDILQIRVADTGCGMDRDLLEEKRRSMVTPPDPDAKHGIAMYNINNRIHIYYGAEYGLSIYSYRNQGTISVIRIPYVTTQEGTDK